MWISRKDYDLLLISGMRLKQENETLLQRVAEMEAEASRLRKGYERNFYAVESDDGGNTVSTIVSSRSARVRDAWVASKPSTRLGVSAGHAKVIEALHLGKVPSLDPTKESQSAQLRLF